MEYKPMNYISTPNNAINSNNNNNNSANAKYKT